MEKKNYRMKIIQAAIIVQWRTLSSSSGVYICNNALF